MAVRGKAAVRVLMTKITTRHVNDEVVVNVFARFRICKEKSVNDIEIVPSEIIIAGGCGALRRGDGIESSVFGNVS